MMKSATPKAKHRSTKQNHLAKLITGTGTT